MTVGTPLAAGEATPSTTKGPGRHLGNVGWTVLSLGLFMGFWVLAAAYIDDRTVLPAPTAVARRFGELATDKGDVSLWLNIRISLQRVVIGLSAGCAIGIPLGAIMGTVRVARRLADPILEIGRPIPPLALAPLLIIWAGLGELPKVLIIMIGVVPIMTISTASAVAGVSQVWRNVALTLGSPQSYTLRKVVIPGALPGIFTGLRIASGTAWGTIVAAELIASTQGLGWLILQRSQFLDVEAVLVGVITIGLLSAGFDAIIRVAEARLVPWKGQAVA